MTRNWRSGRLVILVLFGGLLEPLGHQLAYLLRYGPSQAVRVETIGAHAYFPRLASFSTISLALALTAALLGALGVRLAVGRRASSSGNYAGVFLVLAVVQCVLFTVQEAAEAGAIQATPDFLTIGLLAICAQLPLAAVAAFVVHRLLGILALAPEAVRVVLALRLPRPAGPIRLRSLPVRISTASAPNSRRHPRRGPPLPR